MKLVSPMQRYYSRVTPKDADGSVMEDPDGRYEYYDNNDLNPKVQPCGGAKLGRVHFDAESGTRMNVLWRTVHPDLKGNCTIRLSDGLNEKLVDVMHPADGSADDSGKFPCGRIQNVIEGKEIKLPKNFSCDSCTL
mmetsp:Transcript_32936/g.50365  ORF Transcript_32936/g.50365 Transcript_32936/m.50365 type:complete len:136 (+) Transcript_32936:198-605(+)